jgi:hypothetical protein
MDLELVLNGMYIVVDVMMERKWGVEVCVGGEFGIRR